MDNFEITRRLKRYVDANYSYRKIFLIIVGVFALIWILGFRAFPTDSPSIPSEPAAECLSRKLYRYATEVTDMDTNIVHNPPWEDDKQYVPYVGNGYIGVALYEESLISVKPQNGRTLSAQIPFRPFVRVSVMDEEYRRDATISQYKYGVVLKQACIEFERGDSLEIQARFYAHRAHPSIFEQDVVIKNPGSTEAVVEFEQLGWTGDPPFKSDVKKMQQGDEDLHYVLGSGVIEVNNKFIGVAIVYKKVPNAVTVKAKSSKSVRFITVVNYVHLTSRKQFDSLQTNLLNKSEMELKRALGLSMHNFQILHDNSWKDIWSTGFYISPSRASNALNGDKINATMYYVLSQVRDPIHEANVLPTEVSEAKAVLSYSEGCYGGHHTLQAPSLWSTLESPEDVLSVSNLWLLTLEKLGCHNLLRAGATGVMQGMVLSFGALKFSNHHLEFNTEPKDLHRDYHFRRIWYGNATHVNISVSVGSDNKAVLYAALDRSDKDYYACDAGCLDPPVELGPIRKQFPVKVTAPSTAVLYITSDLRHIEELRLSIHVKEVVEAPAHENHVISMHKHGSGYGAMSTMFWVSISLLIIVFHLFLFHLVYTEYFGSQDKFRTRTKFSTF